jgi:acetyl-CoA synthetase
VRASDVYWNAADAGWAYGLYYNILGPLLVGKPSVFINKVPNW